MRWGKSVSTRMLRRVRRSVFSVPLVCGTGLILLLPLLPMVEACSQELTVSEVRDLFEDELLNMAYTTHEAKNRYDEALQVAEEALKKSPAHPEWRRRAARVAEQCGKSQQALMHWAVLAEQGDGAARQEALRLSRSINEFPIRRSMLEGLLLSGVHDSELLREYVRVSDALGTVADAYRLLASGIMLKDRELQLKEQSRLAEQLGRYEEAVNALDLLALMRPLTAEEQAKRALLQFGGGDRERDWKAAVASGKEQPATIREPDGTVVGRTDEERRGYRWAGKTERDTERRYWALDPPAFGVLVRYKMNRDERTDRGARSVDRSDTVTERVDLATKGYLYHPALLQYRLKFSPEFTQTIQNRNELGRASSVDGSAFSPNVQLNATLLERKPYTVSAFGQHLETQNWNVYSGLSRTTTDSYGADLNLKYALLPTSLGFSSSRSFQNGLTRTGNDWQELHLFSSHKGRTGESSLSATFSTNRQSTNGVPSEIRSSYNRFSNTLPVTADGRMRLLSNLQYQYQEVTAGNPLTSRSLSLFEHLGWQHGRNLRSDYRYSLQQTKSNQSDSRAQSLDASLTHQLYENLTTTAGLTGASTRAVGTAQEGVSGTITSSYQRRLAAWGQLNAAVGLTEQYTNRTGGVTTLSVINEPHTMTGSGETFLEQPDIDRDSVRVANSQGTVVYLEGSDYFLDQVGRSVRIRRVVTGNIADGQLVMVSYRYVSPAGFTDLLLSQSYQVSLELWRAVTLSYRYRKTGQTIVSGPAPDRLNNSELHLADLRLNLGWADSGATFEDTKATSDTSYRRWEVFQGLKWQHAAWLQATARGYYGETRYRSITDFRKHYGGAAGLRWLPFGWMTANAEGYLERVGGNLQNRLNGGAKADLSAVYRLWTLRLAFKYAAQDDHLSDYRRRNQTVQVELIREVW